MKIVHVSAEFAPVAKAGGLGEVLLGLPRELIKLGHDVQIILPKYDLIDLSKLSNVSIEIPNFQCLEAKNTLWSASFEEIPLKLLDARHPAGYFHRGKIYACEDDIARFLYFSRAVLEYLALKNEPIDVLHLHDWHVSFCAPLVKNIFKQLKIGKIVLSIHNLEYQGKCSASDLDLIGVNGESYLTPDALQDNSPKFPDTINLLKGGIVYADEIVPVSPTYAKEILTPKYGFGLDPTLKKHQKKIHGILNGIDQKFWDPTIDPALHLPFSITSYEKGKSAAKKTFPVRQKGPWVGAITRLVAQKGPELIEEALLTTLKSDGCFLLLGSSPVPALQKHFNLLKEKYRANNQVFLHYEYDEEMAHRLYAALDFLVVPSIFEPCGLTQMIAMRYGTVPIVRATGGLKDSVFDGENGFSFPDATKSSLNKALKTAFETFGTAKFDQLIKSGMEWDFSWKKPAKEYEKIYFS